MALTIILPDDPRLTAYALDEMESAERVEFEKLLQQDSAARQVVEEIRATVTSLTTALADEPMPLSVKNEFAQAAIIPGLDPRRFDGGLAPPERLLPKSIKFPQFYFMVSGLAAACFAVFFVYWQENRPSRETRKYIEVPLVTAAIPPEKAPAQQVIAEATETFKNDVQTPAPAAPRNLRDESIASAGPSAVTPLDAEDEKIVLTPFQVTAPSSDDRYRASSTLAGTRLRTPLSDLGGASAPRGTKDLLIVGGSRASRELANAEVYSVRKDNDYVQVAEHPLSTFSVDVDTASYANVRRFLVQGRRPPVDAVRIEEMINYFPYNYSGPEDGETLRKERAPFAAHLEVASAPWAVGHRLVRIGLKGRNVSDAARPMANLVFLIDVSGSMDSANKLPLLKQSLRMLVEKLRPDDRVAMAVYAGASGMALPSTPVSHKADILEAIDQLQARGSTNGAMGIHLAYDIAKANFVLGGVNRVILATDGDFNVGVTSPSDLLRLIQDKAKSGVFLSVLGFGMGNLKDGMLEQIADKGNGNYAYIDSLNEAKKTLVEQAGGTLVTIAKDVKLQVEFNPAVVQAYRLIGYENRLLAKEDFNNDEIDAGEIGAGHTVTALYEVVPVGVEMNAASGVDPLKYQKTAPISDGKKVGRASAELLTVKIRYKEPAGDVSSKLEFPLRDRGMRFADASQDFKFAASVAAFGMLLRDSPYKGSATLSDVVAWGRAGLGSDVGGYRSEFLGLLEKSGTVLR